MNDGDYPSLKTMSDLMRAYSVGRYTRCCLILTSLDWNRLTFLLRFAHWLEAACEQERLDRVRALEQSENEALGSGK